MTVVQTTKTVYDVVVVGGGAVGVGVAIALRHAGILWEGVHGMLMGNDVGTQANMNASLF